jgi:hypothetical protein
VAELDRRFTGTKWLAGRGTVARSARQVKVRAGIWTFAAEASGGTRIVASVVNGRLDRVVLTIPDRPGEARRAEVALAGIQVSAASSVLSRLGEPGSKLASALVGAEGRLG